MLKKNTLGNASKKSLSEAFKCGECLHHKQVAHPAHNDVCSKEGIKAVGIAPSCFTPDVTKIAKNSDQFVQLAAIVNSYTPQERRIFLGVLRSASAKKKPFAFGMKLYFHTGKDFISNYLCGWVMGYTSSGELIVSGSPDQKQRGKSFLAYLSADATGLLTPTQWKTKREKLRAAGKIYDPANAVVKKASIIDDYEPPTIDRAPRDPSEKSQTKKRVVRDTYEFQVS